MTSPQTNAARPRRTLTRCRWGRPGLVLILLGLLPLLLAACGTAAQAAAPSAAHQQRLDVSATSPTPVALTQRQEGLQVTLKVTPDAYGPNQFGVVLRTAATGQPIDGASVQLFSTMLDMAMGTTCFALQPQGQGFYRGQSALSMGGHWQMVVQVRLPSDPRTLTTFTFRFTAAIWQGAN